MLEYFAAFQTGLMNILPFTAQGEQSFLFMLIASWIVGFFLAIWFLGFPAASAIATFLYLKFSGNERWLTSIVPAFIAWGFFYGMFDYALKLPFPDAVLIDWLEV
jgi:hypothetical protein